MNKLKMKHFPCSSNEDFRLMPTICQPIIVGLVKEKLLAVNKTRKINKRL